MIVPEYTVSDNYSSAEKISVAIYVETPAHQLYMLPGNSIQVNHVGVYEFRVMVVDESGNVTVQSYEMTVIANTEAQGV